MLKNYEESLLEKDDDGFQDSDDEIILTKQEEAIVNKHKTKTIKYVRSNLNHKTEKIKTTKKNDIIFSSTMLMVSPTLKINNSSKN